jgi:peptidoglycan hydrolase-like protein with peptidoglycan-binding domain
MLFPNGPGRGPGLAKYYGGDYQEDVRSAIKSAVNVPIIDINGKPLTDGVHATMGVYKEVANEVVTKYKSKSEVPVSGKPSEFAIGKITTNRGPEVADLQKSLVALGYPLPKFGVDGIRGPETSGAIRAFQKSNGLNPTGTPDEETVAKLNDTLKSKPEVAAKLTRSTQADVKSKASVAPLEVSNENISAAKESAEKFLGREMDDNEWNYLLRATVSEASPNTKEQAYVMGVILNRTRSGKWGNSVVSVLTAKNQFQAVTGTRYDPGPSANFTRGPNKTQLASIIKGAIEILPSVDKSLMNFTAASTAAYGPGTNLGFRDTLLAKGGQQIGGTIFA